MVLHSVDGLWDRIWSLQKEIERRCSSLIPTQRAFQRISIRRPRVSPPELAFSQAVTWLYVFYYESGRISLPYLISLLPTYGLSANEIHMRHHADVRTLRTFLQHNLNLETFQDAELQRVCDQWFSTRCGTPNPEDDAEWLSCLVCVLQASGSFLVAVNGCIQEIGSDESSEMMVEQWSLRLSRYHPMHLFEPIVATVLHDIGQGSLDPSQIVERYYARWSNNLRSRQASYQFEEEARKLIEYTLLNELEMVLPITSLDIMKEFGIGPGPEVGRLLRRARTIYLNEPTSGDQLIALLREVEC